MHSLLESSGGVCSDGAAASMRKAVSTRMTRQGAAYRHPPIVRRSPTATRQLASRARRRVRRPATVARADLDGTSARSSRRSSLPRERVTSMRCSRCSTPMSCSEPTPVRMTSQAPAFRQPARTATTSIGCPTLNAPGSGIYSSRTSTSSARAAASVGVAVSAPRCAPLKAGPLSPIRWDGGRGGAFAHGKQSHAERFDTLRRRRLVAGAVRLQWQGRDPGGGASTRIGVRWSASRVPTAGPCPPAREGAPAARREHLAPLRAGGPFTG